MTGEPNREQPFSGKNGVTVCKLYSIEAKEKAVILSTGSSVRGVYFESICLHPDDLGAWSHPNNESAKHLNGPSPRPFPRARRRLRCRFATFTVIEIKTAMDCLVRLLPANESLSLRFAPTI
ncbi:MAG: hypothetical protein ACU83N_04860 [Gammaproteobacteria bacterium]